MKKDKINKSELSVSVSNDILKYIKDNHTNRSKFIQECMIKGITKK